MSLVFGLFNKKVVIGTVVLAIVIIVIVFTRSCDAKKAVSYKFSEIEKGDVIRTVSVNGNLQLYDVVLVRSEIAGEINTVHKGYGDTIAKGDLLLEIFSESIVESYNSYYDTYRFARIDMENARDLFLTKKRLVKEKLIAEREFEDSRLAYQKAVSYFKQVEKTYQRKKELLDSRSVRSESGGLIVEGNYNEGDEIPAGHVLFKIAPTMEKMRLKINIDESDVGIVKKGQTIVFTVSAYPEEVFNGEIEDVLMSPQTIDNVVTYEATAVCLNKKNYLKPGMTASATIHVAHEKNVLRVPNQAFLVTPKEVEAKAGEKILWKKINAADGQMPVSPISIKTGVVGDSYTEITTKNLKLGDEILIGIVVERQ